MNDLATKLFDGELDRGTLPRERILAEYCAGHRTEFSSERNPWRQAVEAYRANLRVDTGSELDWPFKSPDSDVQSRQRDFILALLRRRTLPDKLKALAALLMSTALERPPSHPPPPTR